MNVQIKKYWGVAFGLFALLLRIIFGWQPAWCEFYYSRGLFLGIRIFLDTLWLLLPFSAWYVFVLCLLIWGGYSIRRWRQVYPTRTKGAFVRHVLGQLANSVGLLLGLFFLLWGYNYQRIPLKEQVHLEVRPLTLDELKEEAVRIQDLCLRTRAQVSPDTTQVIGATYLPKHLEDSVRKVLEQVLSEYNYPVIGRMRARLLYPKGIFLHFSTSGMYLPFTGEGHVDAGLHALQLPFTLAHELAHGYGFGSEAVCNFLAYRACILSEVAVVRYVGYLAYWRYIMGELRHLDAEFYKELRATIGNGMDKDLSAIYANLALYPDFFPGVQQAAYNSYLKAQGVKEGIKSYNQLVQYAAAWHRIQKSQ